MAKIINISNLTSNYTMPDDTKKNYQTQSNESATENMTTSFLKEKSTASSYGAPKDEILQTLKLINNSEYPITVTNIKETISSGGTFKAGSLIIGGVAKSDADITKGVALDNPINAGENITITYLLVINESPATDIINTISDISYTVNEDLNFTEKTMVVSIEISDNKITIVKTSNKSAVIKGDKLMFQNVITNNGRYLNTDIFFKDDIPAETSFVENSVKINSELKEGLDPTVGFKLQDMNAGDEITVTFEVEVK